MPVSLKHLFAAPANPDLPGGTAKVHLSLSAKLIFAFLVVTVPSLSVMAAITLFALGDLTNFNQQLQEISRSLEAVEGLEAAVAKTITPLSAYMVKRTPGESERFQAAIREVETRLGSCGATSCHGNPRQPIQMAASLFPYIQGIKERGALVFGSGYELGEEDKIKALYQMIRDGEEAHGRVSRMSSTLLVRVGELEKKSQDLDRRAAILILLSVSLVLSVTAMIAYVSSRRLLGRLGELLAGTRHIMQGDLRYRVGVAAPDEIGQLAQSFNAMAQEIEQHREHLQAMVEAKTAQLKAAQDSLIQSEKLASIGLLASGVAHELNNPLTSILMNVDLLIEDSAGQPGVQKELRRIGEDTSRCKRIIDDLRDFSRRQDLDVSPCDVNALVDSALDSVSRRQEFKGINVEREFSDRLPPVPCDAVRMEEVLTNVLVNAIQAMPQGGSLSVRTVLRSDFAEISVQDTGPGIAEEIRGKIFDPFFTTKPQGTGLGLSIVYRIMEAHGGSVELENVAEAGDRGTRVVLLLPLKAKAPNSKSAAIR